MFLKKALKKVAERVFQSSWYPNRKILLESIPDLSCQTYPLYRKMIEEGLNQEYRIYWLVSDRNCFRSIQEKNVHFENYETKTIFEKIKRKYLLNTSRAMLYANRYIGKVTERQLFVYLKHGTCIKSRLKHCRDNEVNECDACISISHFFDEIDEKELHISRERIINTGYPRNDFLLHRIELGQYFPMFQGKKVIIWMPTFRQGKGGNRVDSTFEFPYGIPCLYSREHFEEVNAELKNRNMILLLKPHPGQDTSFIRDFQLSNVIKVTDEQIREKGLQLYQLISGTDALITDYSSIYYDYLLCKKPIGITLDDFAEYKETTGFVFENVLDIVVGEYLYSHNDMISFIRMVDEGNDRKLKEREAICRKVHDHEDDQSTERVYDYLIDQINQRYGRL